MPVQEVCKFRNYLRASTPLIFDQSSIKYFAGLKSLFDSLSRIWCCFSSPFQFPFSILYRSLDFTLININLHFRLTASMYIVNRYNDSELLTFFLSVNKDEKISIRKMVRYCQSHEVCDNFVEKFWSISLWTLRESSTCGKQVYFALFISSPSSPHWAQYSVFHIGSRAESSPAMNQ